MAKKTDLVCLQKKNGFDHGKRYHDIDDDTGNCKAGGSEYPESRCESWDQPRVRREGGNEKVEGKKWEWEYESWGEQSVFKQCSERRNEAAEHLSSLSTANVMNIFGLFQLLRIYPFRRHNLPLSLETITRNSPKVSKISKIFQLMSLPRIPGIV